MACNKGKIMKTRILTIMFFSVGLLSCNKTKDNSRVVLKEEPINQNITESDISKLSYLEFGLDSKTKDSIEVWKKYFELEELISNIKKGDLSYFKENKVDIIAFLKEFKETIPTSVNTNSVNARITALETKFLKLEDLSNLSSTTKEELRKSIKEFLESFSNLNLQMNKKFEKDSQDIEQP
ncbi:hypothetical protein [Yeosuana sp.]|uniref:hypothetical protein n=1 Tax=Yeosuana sp. TaxID=2529388 RepID=UPI004054A493|tara:strand:+ start:508 stop:1050 length:543 start_codon:yes stop_codon:yes gene_type:complete